MEQIWEVLKEIWVNYAVFDKWFDLMTVVINFFLWFEAIFCSATSATTNVKPRTNRRIWWNIKAFFLALFLKHVVHKSNPTDYLHLLWGINNLYKQMWILTLSIHDTWVFLHASVGASLLLFSRILWRRRSYSVTMFVQSGKLQLFRSFKK